MKKRRWICLALTAALTFGMLAGCGQMKDLSDVPRDLHPGDRDPAALRCGQPHPGGQLCLRAAEQLVGHICRAHFPTLPSVRGLQTPVFRAKYGKIETFPNKNQKNACVGTANMVS